MALRDQVFDRDDHTCQACGWKSRRWQELHHVDGDHRNRAVSNLQTLCPLCHQVFHLPQASATGGGSIVWLPEIDQATLNQMCRTLFVAMHAPRGPWTGIARTLYGALEGRKATLEEALARSASDPGMLAQVLIKLKPEDYARRAETVGSLRLLPHASRFASEIKHWAAHDFPEPTQDAWERLLPAALQPVAASVR